MSFSYNRIVRVPLHIPRARHADFTEFLFQLQQNRSGTIACPSRPTCRFHRVSLSAPTESSGYHRTSLAPDMQISPSFSFRQQNCSGTIARPSRPTCSFNRIVLSVATELFGYHCTSRAPDMQISQSFPFSCNRIIRIPLHVPRARHADFTEFLFQLQQNRSSTIVPTYHSYYFRCSNTILGNQYIDFRSRVGVA